MSPLRVGVLGAGALGTLFAYHLARHTSAEVWLLSRSRRPPFAEVEGEGQISLRVVNRGNEPVDLLLVLVKAYDTAEAVQWARGAIGPETLLLTLQNGLGNGEVLAAALGPDRVLAGTTALGAWSPAPGRVRRGGTGPTWIAPWQPSGPAARRAGEIAALLTGAGIPTEAAPDPQPLLWAKLAVNAGINPLTALLRVNNGELLVRPDARRLMAAATQEAAAVAAALGVVLVEDPRVRVRAVAESTAANRSSMLQDVAAGRRTEIEAINGAVAERGRALGVPTPVNETLTALIRALRP
ncbi:MAG TPA: 2-dehydropantoate 2-reductase [Symbiobacteriaceae bacterium]|jgi:2-dehydropantoate 2-reductase